MGKLEESSLVESKPSKIPMERHINIRNDKEKPFLNPTLYRSLVGKFIYLNITNPDLIFPIHWLSKFMGSPIEIHLCVLFKLIRYLKMAS